MNQSDFDPELEDLYQKSVKRLACAEVFDHQAFTNLLTYMRKKAGLIVGDFVISKQVVFYLLQAESFITKKAHWLPEVESHVSMAQEFSLLLSQIASGIDPAERQPGVPRVV
ncbi:hypothetical protein [Pseudomonas paralcaligenes]|uniref:hypothetical protein n=1 Tax=Pseudomonas paralcaligenes TaxID=2772558 RepID=UPI001C800F8C|nr:hypothetical protein [Pseudomonas paralcaligenes]